MNDVWDIARVTGIIRRKRLGQLAAAYGGQSAVAAKIGRDRNQVWQWLREDGDPRGRAMNTDSARAIEEALGLPFGWLDSESMAPVIGRGAAELVFSTLNVGNHPALKGVAEAVSGYGSEDDYVWIPVLGSSEPGQPDTEVEVPFYTSAAAAAGNGHKNGDADNVVKLRFRAASLRRKGINPETACLIYVRGESMEPQLSDGDQIMFDRSKTTIRDGELYVIRIDGDELVKRLHKRPGGRLVVQADNPAFEAYEISPDTAGFEVLGQVVWRAGWM